MAGFLKVPSSHGLDEDDTGSKINHLRLSGENKRHLQLRGMSFRSTSTNSLHLDAAAVAEPGTRPDAVRRKLGLRIDTNVASCCTRRPDDGASLTPVEVQAVGPLVHLYNNRHYDNIVSPSAAGPSDTAVPFTGDNNLDPGVRPVLRRQRTWISLLLHREDEVQETNVLRKSRSVYGALCHVSATSNTTGGADQPSVLKKKPSLFFRLLNGAETFVDDKPSSYGCENVPKLGVSHWTGNLSTRMSLLYTPCGGYNPELVNEVGRYFGSNAVRQQLLLAAIKPKQSVFIHHPINLYILVSRQRKQETESKCRGNGLPKGKRSYMSLRNSRLSSASYMRTINRHGENWKLFEFSKVSGVPIGEGELCHSGDFRMTPT